MEQSYSGVQYLYRVSCMDISFMTSVIHRYLCNIGLNVRVDNHGVLIESVRDELLMAFTRPARQACMFRHNAFHTKQPTSSHGIGLNLIWSCILAVAT